MEFTAHDTALPGDEDTLPGRARLSDEPLCRAVLRTLRILFPDAARTRPRVADLGALEGGHAVELARAGFDVVAIDARAGGGAAVADRPGHPNLRVVRDDARNVERHGPFDAVCCCGLLHRLDAPAAFLTAMGRAARRVLLVDTHYAGETQRGPWKLSGMARHEGNLGRWLVERPEGAPPEPHDAGPSGLSGRAFWLERTHLIEAIRTAGFDTVYEQYDRLRHAVEDDWIQRWSRSLFVGVKAG